MQIRSNVVNLYYIPMAGNLKKLVDTWTLALLGILHMIMEQ